MNVILAKTAGFCFGVERAVTMTMDLLRNGTKIALLGALIHNKQVTRELQDLGATTIDRPEDCPADSTIVIRAHGVPQNVMKKITASNRSVCNATCPFVAKIHKIVDTHSSPERPTIVLGDPKHPEIIGICSFSRGSVYVTQSPSMLEELLLANPKWNDLSPIVVAQTTFHAGDWKKCINILKSLCTNAQIFDTICNATQTRQDEARALAATCGAMLIIGDASSSNTAKLKSVCDELCPSFLIEGYEELRMLKDELTQYRTIGCTAGASTPTRTIKEVLQTMADLENELQTIPNAEEIAQTEPVETLAAAPESVDELPTETLSEEDAFAAALEESLKAMNSDQKVKGYVTAVNPSEIQVDIGRKQTGYVAASEYSNDPTADPTLEVHVGDVLNLIILKTNDLEGTIQLSKKRFDAAQAWQDIIAAEESGDVLDGKVYDVVKGGVLAIVRGCRVFIPGSHTGIPRDGDLETLRGKEVKLRIIEVNKPKRRAVGSIRNASSEIRKAAEERFWAQVEVGQSYKGIVKSIVSFGAFVDVGGLDGMLHISELSWSRIKDPHDVLKIGQEVDVFIKALDTEKRKISLGYRKTEDNPWEVLREKYPVNSVVDATIVGFTAFGAFARVLPGIDGLIHISQIADRHIEKPQNELQMGQVVQVKIVGVDFDKKRVSLSMRALLAKEDPEPDASEDEVVASSSSEDE
ncbi:MAG: bifunctional 4-hydroxy-3-methylbut-2-enyl diphosphate reductase/30S ribosomal protein S1 [Oscillospiraceae bacterium]|jgi:4-hydroxy-3-methylbut-2-enyl diphosphate reductase|nr:bifunctional 4-hydroxy-3-methylbut-2-enyl diphosphate reductase/30S ribosomal protein S1 [Oscillospiraceae bacterium]